MTFTEEWFGEASQQALADLYRQVAELDGDVVEVGCWEGRSTIALANACHPVTVHAVDTWEGSPGEVSSVLAKQRDVAYTFACNVEEQTKGNVQAHRMGWRDYFASHRDPVKFVHIDATHSYREVRDNLRAVLTLLVPGGVVCGDDAHHPPVRQAVLDVLGDAGLAATLWHWRKQ